MTEASDSLREILLTNHLEKHVLEQRAYDEAVEAHKEQHIGEQKAEQTALEAERHRLQDHRIAHEAAHNSHEKLHEAFGDAHRQQHESEQRAVDAAVKAMDRRLDSMNEFRDQLRDQAATFLRREQLEAFIGQYERAHDEVLALVATEREERRKNESDHALIHRGEEGGRKGMGQLIGWVVAAIGAAAALLGIVIIMTNLLTGR